MAKNEGKKRNKYERPKDFRKTLRTLLGYIGKAKWELILVMLMVMSSSVLNLAGSYMLKPVINEGIVPQDYDRLLRLLILTGVIYLANALVSYSYRKVMSRVSQKTTHLIREELFVKLQGLPLRFFDVHSRGELMSRFTNDVDTVSEVLNSGFVSLVSSGVTLIGTVSLMVFLNPLLFLVTLASLALTVLVVTTIGKRSRVFFAAQQKAMGDMNGYIEEMVQGIKVVKVFNHEQTAREDFESFNTAFLNAARTGQFNAGAMNPISNGISNLSYAVTCCVASLLSILRGFDLGSLVVYLGYVKQVGNPINQISNQLNNLMSAVAGAERVFEIMEEVPEQTEGKAELVRLEDGAQSGRTEWAWKMDGALIPLKGDVRFENVCFSYVPGTPVLKGLSLYAYPGQKIAFVGSTGAGKTTITNLINRFYEIQEGKITYDGIDIRDIDLKSLRSSLGYVLQDTHLFTGTIADNIRFGRLDATDEEVRSAAELANADRFIRNLPDGYDTVITGDGENLSQGERQLLAIARAAVSGCPVLILDEATSSIDTHTEKLIERGMDQLMEGRTVFIIAHRLSTVRNADAIIVLEHGETIERGNHESLLAQKGRYYQLYNGLAELT